MRVIWRDSAKPKEYKPIKYREIQISGTPKGWAVDLPGDDNLYRSHYCAQNAIDDYFGDYGQRGTQKRKACGIEIIGRKGDITA